MKSNPTLRGRYEGSVLSPLQWVLLAGVGYVVVLGLQVDTLLHTSFRIDLLGHEVVRVEQAARPVARPATPITARIRTVVPEDWPAPPVQTAWTPETEPGVILEEIVSIRQ